MRGSGDVWVIGEKPSPGKRLFRHREWVVRPAHSRKCFFSSFRTDRTQTPCPRFGGAGNVSAGLDPGGGVEISPCARDARRDAWPASAKVPRPAMPNFSDPIPQLWGLFAVLVAVIAALDLALVTHRHGEVGVRHALRWTTIWVGLALAYGAAIHFLHPAGTKTAALYVAGYLTEYSLSVDNLFVFILIFSLMGVPATAQPRLLKLGIYLSIALRIAFILGGIGLVERFHWLIYVFGALLIWTGWKMLRAGDDDHIDPTRNLLHRMASRFLRLHPGDGASARMFHREGGKWFVTPMFLVFLVIGSTDLLFAVDSIPAIVGISTDPFVVITSNVFAVLGLNSLFFALRGIMGLFKFLKQGVSVILFFIGAKMLAAAHGPTDHWFKANSWVSLAVIAGILVVSIVVSLVHSRLSPTPHRPEADGEGPGKKP